MLKTYWLAVLLLNAMLAGHALAGGINISPIRLNLSDQQHIGVLTLRNEGSEPSVIQVEVADWQQTEDGRNEYVASRNLLATPPLFSIPAGGSQIVRVGLLKRTESQQEGAYRVFLQEVPTPNGNKDSVRMVLRLSIPVFVMPFGEAELGRLQWRLSSVEDEKWSLEAINAGNVHIQINGITLKDQAGHVIVEQQGMNYILPGKAHRWIFSPSQSLSNGLRMKVTARSDAGEIVADVVSGN